MREQGRELGIQLGLRLRTHEIKIKAFEPTDYQRKRARAYIVGTLMEKAQEQNPIVASYNETTKPLDLQGIRALVEECSALNIPLVLTEKITSYIFNESGRIALSSESIIFLQTPYPPKVLK